MGIAKRDLPIMYGEIKGHKGGRKSKGIQVGGNQRAHGWEGIKGG